MIDQTPRLNLPTSPHATITQNRQKGLKHVNAKGSRSLRIIVTFELPVVDDCVSREPRTGARMTPALVRDAVRRQIARHVEALSIDGTTAPRVVAVVVTDN